MLFPEKKIKLPTFKRKKILVFSEITIRDKKNLHIYKKNPIFSEIIAVIICEKKIRKHYFSGVFVIKGTILLKTGHTYVNNNMSYFHQDTS